MITNLKTYSVGYEFMVPAVSELLAYGCANIASTWRPPEDKGTLAIGTYDYKIKNFGGKLAKVRGHFSTNYYDCTVEGNFVTLHVEMCEVITSQTKGTSVTWTSATTGGSYIPVKAWPETGLVYNAVGTNHHQCIEGKTPIFGKIICKDCGKDIRDF